MEALCLDIITVGVDPNTTPDGNVTYSIVSKDILYFSRLEFYSLAVNNQLIGIGGGRSRRRATNAAADSAIRHLHYCYYQQYPWAFRGL